MEELPSMRDSVIIEQDFRSFYLKMLKKDH